MTETKHTPRPWYVGAQNDAIYIIAGKPPSKDNDSPVHDANRLVLAKIYEPNNADLFEAAPDLLDCLKRTKVLIEREGIKLDSYSRMSIETAIAKAEGK